MSSSKNPPEQAKPPLNTPPKRVRPNYLHRLSHRIKKYLNKHISLPNLKLAAFLVSLLSCLSAGSIMLFSLFTRSLYHAGISYFKLNLIASASYVGMYLCLPVLGYLGDCYGPAVLSLLSIFFFCPSYLINSYLVGRMQQSPDQIVSDSRELQNYVYGFGATFFCIGLATSSLYFASVITCAKIYPNHKGLAISFPVSCYGLSTLIGSQLLKLSYFAHPEDPSILDLHKVFMFFGVLYFFMGILNFLSNSIVIVEQEVLFTNPNSPNEESPLIEEEEPSHGAAADVIVNESDSENEDTNSLLPQRSIIEPQNHQQRYKQFLNDKSAWILLLAITLNLGPLESYQVNLGSILDIEAPTILASDQISVMAASSTLSRLLLGGMSDFISSDKRKYPICRIWLVIGVLVIGSFGQYANNLFEQGIIPDQYYPVVSALNGISYGGLFTIYPTVVATIWGLDMMGSTWGSFMVAPAIGSVVYSLFYGKIADSELHGGGSSIGSYFQVTSFSMLISLGLVVVVWKGFWSQRGFKLF